MTHSVKLGQTYSEEASSAFQEIAESSEETYNQATDISESVNLQINAIHQVVQLMENVVVITEETAAGTEQIATSAAELSSGMTDYQQKANQMTAIAEKFKVGVADLKFSNPD